MTTALPKLTLAVSLSLLVFVFGIQSVQAAGITIAPSFKDIQINTEDPVEANISVTNNSNVELKFMVEVTDFGASDGAGGISLNVGDNYKYGLKNYVILDTNQLTVAPKARGSVVVTISNIANLSPGGHYGAILFTLKDDSSENIPVKQTAVSLLFVVKNGGDGAKLSTRNLKFQPSLFKLPAEAEVVIANEGNVHAAPDGEISIKDPRSREIFAGQINSTNGKILPETARKFVLGIKTGRLSMPGRYTLQATIDGKTTTQQFFMFPKTSLIIGGLVLVITTIVLRRKWITRKSKSFRSNKPSRK